MMALYIVETTKSASVKLMVWCHLACGSVADYFVPAAHYMTQQISLLGTQTVNFTFRTLPLDPKALNLMLIVAKAANVPEEKITGFKRSQGRWFICLKEIGWLRTSDLLQMQIKLFTQPEVTK